MVLIICTKYNCFLFYFLYMSYVLFLLMCISKYPYNERGVHFISPYLLPFPYWYVFAQLLDIHIQWSHLYIFTIFVYLLFLFLPPWVETFSMQARLFCLLIFIYILFIYFCIQHLVSTLTPRSLFIWGHRTNPYDHALHGVWLLPSCVFSNSGTFPEWGADCRVFSNSGTFLEWWADCCPQGMSCQPRPSTSAHAHGARALRWFLHASHRPWCRMLCVRISDDWCTTHISLQLIYYCSYTPIT